MDVVRIMNKVAIPYDDNSEEMKAICECIEAYKKLDSEKEIAKINKEIRENETNLY